MILVNRPGSTQPPSFRGRKMSTGQEAVAMLCGWEGNRSSGVILVMRHGLCDVYIHPCARAQWPKGGVFHCSENRDWKLIFISRGHVLRDWQWRKINVTERMFCLAYENNGRRWRWRIHCVSKNVPLLACYSFGPCKRILIFLAEMLPIK